jgi:hypothetical protein
VWCGYDLRRLKVEFPACTDDFGWFFLLLKRAVSLVCEKVVGGTVRTLYAEASAAPGTFK